MIANERRANPDPDLGWNSVGGTGIDPVASSVSVKPDLRLAVAWWALNCCSVGRRCSTRSGVGSRWLLVLALFDRASLPRDGRPVVGKPGPRSRSLATRECSVT